MIDGNTYIKYSETVSQSGGGLTLEEFGLLLFFALRGEGTIDEVTENFDVPRYSAQKIIRSLKNKGWLVGVRRGRRRSEPDKLYVVWKSH